MRDATTARTVLLVVVTVAAGVAAAAAGAPVALVALATAGVGAALVGSWLSHRRFAGARGLAGAELDRYPVQLPAERVAVGRLVQLRLLPPTRALWAPGVLCASAGEVRFVPARAKHADRSWQGPVRAVEVHGLAGSTSVVRVLDGADPSAAAAQFVVQQPATEVARALDGYLEVTRSARR